MPEQDIIAIDQSKTKRHLTLLATLGFGLIGGVGAFELGWPLPWLMGSLTFVAILSGVGLPTVAPKYGRRVGQFIIGCAIGLQITPAVAAKLAVWLPWMVISAFVSIFATVLVIGFFQRLTGVDRATAWFAVLPGGVAEMANISQQAGGQSAPVALAQVARVALTVTVIPPVVAWLQSVEPDHLQARPAGASWPDLLVGLWPLGQISVVGSLMLGVAGVVGAVVAHRLAIANPWLLGSLVGVALLAGGGVDFPSVPLALLALAQLLIGVSLGTAFTAQALRAMPAVVLASVGVFVLSFSVVLMLAYVTVWLFELDAPGAILLFATGGMAEMVLTAKTLGLDVPMVSAFQAVRVLLVNAFASVIWQRLLNRTTRTQ